jgi:carbamoyltransferase
MKILGISAFYHDSAATLLVDGEIVAAAQEERFTRCKHDSGFPHRAVAYCLETAGITAEALDCVIFYDKPFLKFERLLMTYIGTAPKGLRSFIEHMPPWMKERIFMRGHLRAQLGGYKGEVLFSTHHLSHAASAFYPSPHEEAAILTMDGVGEWATTTFGIGRGNRIELLKEIKFPHSLGLLYSAFTYFTGFKVNSGEYKLMGLAPYGLPKYVDLIRRELIDLRDDGSFRLNMKYFDYCAGVRMTNAKFSALFDGPPRAPESPLTQREMDIARSIQMVTEEVVLNAAREVHRITGAKHLCLAGGVALNCVANGRLLREGPFESIWIQPCAGDGGTALGAALLAWHQAHGQPRMPDAARQKGSLLGPEYTDDDIQAALDAAGAVYQRLDDAALPESVANLIASGNVVGWFQGRMEFGPRALGARSILADPRSRDMQSVLNLKIKFRESFRPFAPSVLQERATEYFELPGGDSPYMLLVAPVRTEHLCPLSPEDKATPGFGQLKVARSTLPAITHVDNSARVQTVTREFNPRYHALLTAFAAQTGCPVVVNTSFNVRGEPIVCTPLEAYTCFRRTDMDYLCIGNFLLQKTAQRPWQDAEDWRKQFELD